MTFEEARAQFPVLEWIAYLNAGTFGPLSLATMAAMRTEQEHDLERGRSGERYFLRTLELRSELRAEIAALVDAEPSQVALTSSTTDGCNIVLGGLGLTSEDEVVTTSHEHFGLLGALGASAAQVVVAEPEPERILAAVSPRTRLIAVSQVLWTTGRVLPVRSMRERAGVPVLVDGAQSVGAIPVAAGGVDFLTISGQKWLCGPDTTGALVVADPEQLRVTAPSYFSQERYQPDGSFQPKAGAPRFEPNWWSSASLSGLLAALRARPEWAFERAAAVADRCRSLLAAHVDVGAPEQRSTLVSFRPVGDATAQVARLAERGVHVREIPGSGLVRVSCGWWTSDADLDRLVSSLS